MEKIESDIMDVKNRQQGKRKQNIGRLAVRDWPWNGGKALRRVAELVTDHPPFQSPC